MNDRAILKSIQKLINPLSSCAYAVDEFAYSLQTDSVRNVEKTGYALGIISDRLDDISRDLFNLMDSMVIEEDEE